MQRRQWNESKGNAPDFLGLESGFFATSKNPNRVGAPHAVYKIIGWQKADGKFTARGYIIKEDDRESDLSVFLESIDTIEAETALDFFADLDDEAEEELESVRFTSLGDDM